MKDFIEIGRKAASSIHGPATVLIVDKNGRLAVHFDSSPYPSNSVDCWYERDDTGVYSAGHGIDILTFEGESDANESA